MENAVSQRKVRKTVDLNPNPAAPLQITDSEKNKVRITYSVYFGVLFIWWYAA